MNLYNYKVHSEHIKIIKIVAINYSGCKILHLKWIIDLYRKHFCSCDLAASNMHRDVGLPWFCCYKIPDVCHYLFRILDAPAALYSNLRNGHWLHITTCTV